MGKSNRIRTNRAGATLSGVAPRKKREMPSWAINLITIVVAAIILVSVVLSIMSANGVFPRMQTAMRTENFRVNRNMMTYYFQTQYNNFVSQNSSYLQYYGLDTSLSLKEQYVDTKEDGTQYSWFDYMADQTKTQVKQMLVYCEEAQARGIELDAEDEAYVDEQIAALKSYADMYGYDLNSYIASIYGKGVKKGDVRDAIELSRLASKCTQVLSDEIKAGITDADIDAEYAANAKDYNFVDFLNYSIKVTYDEAAEAELGKADFTDEEAAAKKDDIIKKYDEMIKAAKDKAAALEGAADEKTFKDLVADYEIELVYDDIYEEIISESEVTETTTPEKATVDAIRPKLIAKVLEAIKSGAEFDAKAIVSDENVVLGEFTVDKTYGEALEEVAQAVYDNVKAAVEGSLSDETAYTDADDIVEWAFEDGRAVGNVKRLEEGDSADGAELSTNADELKEFSVTVGRMVKTAYRSDKLTKNLGIMVFSSTTDATDAIARLTKGMSLEDFEAILTMPKPLIVWTTINCRKF